MKKLIDINRSILLFFAVSLFAGNSLYSQVTIGSGTAPNEGALLDLKTELSSSAITSTMGLGMPRVQLIQIKPSTESAFSASIGGTGSWNLTEHIGLFVYNTAVGVDSSTGDNIYEGLYVWDGTMWQHLGNGSGGSTTIGGQGCTPTASRTIGTFTDTRDGEVYHYASFGPAGYWMTQNLRYIPKSTNNVSGTEDFKNTLGDNGSTPSVSTILGKYFIFPESNSYSNNGMNWIDTNNRVNGLLYSWHAATNSQNTKNENKNEKQNQTSLAIGVQEVEAVFETASGKKNGAIQGLCPEGWHIASDREWNYLEEEINYCPTVYADDYEITNKRRNEYIYPLILWDDDWSTGTGWDGSGYRGIHAFAMMSKTSPANTSASMTGKSKAYNDGGLDIKLIGEAYQNFGQKVITYGKGAGFWSSSTYGSSGGAEAAIPRLFSNTGNGMTGNGAVGRMSSQATENAVNRLRSIRCMRHDKP